MKARIVQSFGFYYGEVYISGYWEKVTDPCYTKIGVRHLLKKWKENSYPEEFEI